MNDERLADALARLVAGRAVDGKRVLVERHGVGVLLDVSNDDGDSSWEVRLSSTMASAGASADGAYRADPRPRVAGRPHVALRLEGRRDRLGKSLRLNREILTGDEAFDNNVYLQSHAPNEAVLPLFAATLVRAGALALLGEGWRDVVIDGPRGVVRAGITLQAEDLPSLVQRIDPAISRLAELTSALPLLEGNRTWGPRFIDRASPIIGFAVFVAGAVLCVWGVHDYQTEDHGCAWRAARMGLLAWPVIAALFYLLARGRSEGLSTFGFCVLPMLLGLPAGFAGATLVVNGKLDRGAEAAYSVKVVDKRSRHGSKQTYYYLYTDDYKRPPSPSPLELEVDRERYEAAKVGGQLVMTFKPGRLGYRWLVDLRVPSPAP